VSPESPAREPSTSEPNRAAPQLEGERTLPLDPGTASNAQPEPAPSCKPNGKARNPLVSQIFTADPNAVVYGDRVYVYASHDADGQDGFDMVDYHVFSSSDMVNWRDHGVIIDVDSLPWATRLFAPGACAKNGKYYLYMPDNGSAIGVAVADDPGGPFVDALGKPLLTRQAEMNTDVTWLFDPACLVDEDGQAYLYFGGGDDGAVRDNARVIRLGNDMISLADARATTIPIPRFFEASFVHKHDGTYFLQYSADFSMGASLEYLTSQDPMAGFQYRGVLLPSGGINSGNNNHGSLIDFRGRAYQFYHNRKLMQQLGTNKVNNRSMAVQEISYAADGALNPIEMSTQDTTVAQLECLDGFVEVQAETLAAEKGIEVEGRAGETVRVAQIDDGDWVGYSQVDFRAGARALLVRVAAATSGGVIDVRIDGCDNFTSEAGASIGRCQIPGTAGGTFTSVSCPLSETSGVHDLCLSFSGGAPFELDSWHLE
jgi:arabinoxylan arabinofuranohydrolase